MIKLIFLTYFLISVAFAGPREEAQIILRSVSQISSFSTRLDLISQKFLGQPYGFGGPLGEGPDGRYDQDPLYRFDVFDCTTYLETVISLAQSRNVDEFETFMNEIRYEDGEVDYLKRGHFTDLQWIPNNIQNGLLTEINDQIVYPSEILVARALIDLPNWLRHIKLEEIQIPYVSLEERKQRLAELQSFAQDFTIQTAEINYIPFSTLINNPTFLNRIPHAAIVNFVRPNWDLTATLGTHQNISHQAFLFRRNGVLILRHASPLVNGGMVTEIPFLDYIKKYEAHPTLKGVHFMRVNF